MNAARTTKDEGASARDASPLKQHLQPCDCAGAAPAVKCFATLQDHLALFGFTLTRATDGYYVVAGSSQAHHPKTIQQVERVQRSAAK